MNWHSIVQLLALLFNLSCWVYIFARNRRSAISRAYLLLAGAINTWLFFDLLSCADLPPLAIAVSFKAAGVGTLFCGFLFLNFVHEALKRKRDVLWALSLILAIGGVLLNVSTNVISAGYVEYSWGRDILRQPMFIPTIVIVILCPTIVALIVLARGLHSDTAQRRALTLVSIGIVLMLIAASVSDIVLPAMAHTAHFPSLGAPSATILSAFVFWALIRHDFLSIDLESAAMMLFDNIADGVLITDRQGKIKLANDAAETLFGDITLLERSVDTLFDDYDCRQRYEDHETKTRETSHMVSISQAPIHQGSRRVGQLLIIRNLTAKAQIQEEIIKRQRIESIGVLAGGIAHDFNNILTSLIGNITLARMAQSPGDPAIDLLAEAEAGVLRARHLTNQLLTFSKGGEPIRKSVSTKDFIHDALQFSTAGSNVACTFTPSENLWNILADEGQLNQVLNNLVINSMQAMPQGGTIRVEARNLDVVLDPDQIVPPGQYVEIKVIDEGVGIEAEHLQHIFDPYYSTKSEGSGLGLASTFSIVQRHGGHIEVTSQKNQGTTFRIMIPATEDHALPNPSRSSVRNMVQRGRVLLMDDDESILRAGTRILAKFGYDVLTAHDGGEALEAYRDALDSGRPIDVVVMDLTIPGAMGGKEAIKKLLELDPDARAIVSSGYSNDPVMGNCTNYGFRAVITKPYEIEEFIATIDRVRIEEPSFSLESDVFFAED